MTDRRFAATGRLLGQPALERLVRAHAVVAGMGGVGSWAAEALVRTGVGTITIIDLDHIAESNVNRQVHALESTLGAAKVDVMGRRLHQIAPRADIRAIDAFVEPDNLEELIPAQADVVVDAIDAVPAKAALVAWCVQRGIAVVTCGAAGGRVDPLRLQCADLARTSGDSLLASLRTRLRRRYGFPPAAGATNRDLAHARRFGVPAIFSNEPRSGAGPSDGAVDGETGIGRGGAPLACAGYGSIVTVTGAMGFAAASRAIDAILRRPLPPGKAARGVSPRRQDP